MEKRYLTLVTSAILAGWPTTSFATKYVPDIVLARPYYDEVDLNSYWMSEKLDGIRAIWTGKKLVTRSGRQLMAPQWFLDSLPNFGVEGELWAGRGGFQLVQKTVLDKTPDQYGWEQIKFMLFDLYGAQEVYEDRYHKLINSERFEQHSFISVVSHKPVKSRNALYRFMREVLSQGGEGVMLRKVGSGYVSGRSDHLLKLKQISDTEARVIGYKNGRGKYAGKMGALLVELKNGNQMYIGSGFSDQQRSVPPAIGDTITIQYSGYTSSGLPRFARFLRIRAEE